MTEGKLLGQSNYRKDQQQKTNLFRDVAKLSNIEKKSENCVQFGPKSGRIPERKKTCGVGFQQIAKGFHSTDFELKMGISFAQNLSLCTYRPLSHSLHLQFTDWFARVKM